MTTCPAGHECPADEMTKPTPCNKGTYQTETGQTSCDACPEGLTLKF